MPLRSLGRVSALTSINRRAIGTTRRQQCFAALARRDWRARRTLQPGYQLHISHLRAARSVHHLDIRQFPSYPYATHRQASLSPIAQDDNVLNGQIDEDDTIFALSSGGGGASIGSGATAVAVIRISGPCAFVALRELLSPFPLHEDGEKDGGAKLPKLPKARMASLRTLYDPLNDGDGSLPQRDPLDSALVLTFPGPNSFTGEDIVELHCHGSRAVVQGEEVAASPGRSGEFTQRAYGNGKLGLVEVEALSDLIVADTSLQRKQALRQFDGRLSRLYLGWREELIKGLAHAEAVIDFGDDEALDADEEEDGMEGDGGMSIWGTIRPRISSLRQAMEKHLADASRGELLRDGLRIAIVGRPNAGKSSLLNLLAGRDAAIVSSTPGTTRDVVEVILDLGGVRCTLLDTAGVREEMEEGVNDIEVEGMRRARKAARDAHLIVGVVDASDIERGLNAVDELIDGSDDESTDNESSVTNSKNVLYVLNKLDLVNGDHPSPADEMDEDSTFGISCSTNEGIDAFLSSLTERALSLVSDESDLQNSSLASVEGTEGAVITRARHRRHVEAAADALARFEDLSGQGYMALDMAAEELRLAASELGRITGAIDVENVLDVLFADFCIGK